MKRISAVNVSARQKQKPFIKNILFRLRPYSKLFEIYPIQLMLRIRFHFRYPVVSVTVTELHNIPDR